MPIQHLSYPISLLGPKFVASTRYQSVWLQHWGEPLEKQHDGKMIVVHDNLYESESIWALEDYARIKSEINSTFSTKKQGCLLIGSEGIC
ncbi:hypothetical protein GYMLUDRAFT_48782, partial [Collybiopsis luxurians FD-317 M1]